MQAEHVFAAIESASDGMVTEGCVGAGTGTSCYGHKGGIGTASRQVEDYTVGVLMQTNFGRRDELTILGVPIGQHLAAGDEPDSGDGSVMIVVATDAPLTSRQLGRLAHRVAFGLGRTGTVCHHGSGDFVIAFSTSRWETTIPDHEHTLFNGLFRAVVECVEESVYNALVAAKTTIGKDGRILEALSHDSLRQWLTHYRRG